MFGKKRIQMMDLFDTFQPTSKSSLKAFCMKTAGGNVKLAGELYDFYIKDMEELPMFDPVPPTFMDNAKNTVGGFFDFVKGNKDEIVQVADFVRGLIGKRGATVNPPTEALPPIN